MMGTKMFYKRGVVIAVAVVALMSLTAGVAAAATLKAINVSALGSVTSVGLAEGSTVKSKFSFDESGAISSVKIHTKGEVILGTIDAMTGCDPKKPKHVGVCPMVDELLSGGGVLSQHSSKATLTVVAADSIEGIPVLWGFLDGKLNANVNFTGGGGEEMSGKAKLHISSPGFTPTDMSAYACIGAGGIPTAIEACVADKGHNTFGLEPVIAPIVLNVVDTGKIKLNGSAGKLNGDLQVSVFSAPGTTIGGIALSDGKVTLK